MKILGRILFILGLIPLGGFILMFFSNGLFAFVGVINTYVPWVWWIIGGGLILSLTGFIISKKCGDDWISRRFSKSNDTAKYSGSGNNGYGDYNGSGSDSAESRFENRYPYEYDNETGFSRFTFDNPDIWKDSVGNEYEQKTDCWGNPYYERIEDYD